MKYEKLFEAGNRAQLEKLQENEGKKDGWDDISIGFAIARLKEELGELALSYHTESSDQVRRAAADVANFAHMIILTTDKAIAKRQEERG